MWQILQHETAEDFVLATGEMRTVREFASEAFRNTGVELEWRGKGVDEEGIVEKIDASVLNNKFGISDNNIVKGDVVVEIAALYYRSTEVDYFVGDSSKAEKLLGWKAKTKFAELVEIMIDAEIEDAKLEPSMY
jgi:GDPmannose 4,6-dehydratase